MKKNKKAESFLVPSYYLLLLGKIMSWPESCVMVSCRHGGASQKDWERVCYGSGACNFHKVRVSPPKNLFFILL